MPYLKSLPVCIENVSNFGLTKVKTGSFLHMKKKNNAQDSTRPMVDRIQGLSNPELITVLKKRALYQPEAAGMAIQEAIRRGIIHSEEDLHSPEFETSVSRFSIFPYSDSEQIREKIVKSLMRSVMIAAIIPVYFGVMKFLIPKYIEGTCLISTGVIWVAMAWFIMERSERKLILPMIILTVLSIIYTGRIMLAYSHLKWSDYFITIVLYLFIFYALSYTYTLLKNRGKTGDK